MVARRGHTKKQEPASKLRQHEGKEKGERLRHKGKGTGAKVQNNGKGNGCWGSTKGFRGVW